MDRVKNYSNENDEDADDINLVDSCLAKIFFKMIKLIQMNRICLQTQIYRSRFRNLILLQGKINTQNKHSPGIEDSEEDPVFGHRAFVSASTKFLKIYFVCRT